MFCMYCGQKLTDSARPPSETHTQTFTPNADQVYSGIDDDLPPAQEPAPEEVGGYKLVKMLGAGGMGTVYEAEAPGSGHRVAVKLLSSRLASNPSSVERFRQEGRLASQLTHPRCVFVLSADTENGRPYIVMELMPGRTLKDLIDERGPLSQHEAITRTLDIIDGLSEAHRVGMIHRDVKPSNCFLTADDRVKVGDFGLSKSLAGTGQNHLTQTGAFLGTVLFASPEQIRGEPLDYGSDVYSVAATLYFLLTGQAPFHHESAATALAKAISDPLPRIRTKRPEVTAELESVLLRGLERDRTRRWQTLDDLREALVDLLPERQRPARPRVLAAAYILDRILLTFLIFPAEVLRIWLEGSRTGKIDLFELRWLPVGLLMAYFALSEGLLGATPGKWLLGLRVSRIGQTGPPGVSRALVRVFVFHALLAGAFFIPEELIHWFGPGLGGVLGTVAFLGSATAILLQVRKKWCYRGIHDFASGCRVTQRPLGARKLRLAVRQPTPLQTLLPPPADALPEVVGGYVVRGRLSVESNDEQVWLAEDRSLGRSVLLWLRPWGTLSLNTDPGRPTRLRRVGRGAISWGGTGFDWTAFAAPLGGPLVEAVRPGYPMPWADARYLLEQLVEEFRVAETESSVPPRLALDHVWVEPNGRVQVLDFPLCASHYRPNEPLAVLREVTSLVLEGQPRSNNGPVRAPLPAHASRVLNQLFETEPPLVEFQKELAETHAQQPEVTAQVRAAHLGIQAALLALPVATMFAIAFMLALFMAFESTLQAQRAKQAAEVLAHPETLTRLPDAVTPELLSALSNPNAKSRVNELVERTQAEEEIRRAQLFRPQRLILERSGADRTVFSPSAVEPVLLWAGAPAGSSQARSRAPWVSVVPIVSMVFALVPVGLMLFAGVTRRGVSMMLAGIAIIRADGRPAYRRQCSFRAGLVWFPITALLLGSILLQVYLPDAMYLAAVLWLLAAALLPIYAVIALRLPARPPQDRLAGTYLVPV